MMTSERKNMILYKRNIKRYLAELSHLTGNEVKEDQLLSLDQTERIRSESIKILDRTNVKRFEIHQSERAGKRFTEFIQRLYELNPSPVYVWIGGTNYCGLLEIPSILQFNFEYNFYLDEKPINEENPINLLSKTLQNEILLDYEFSPEGEGIMEIRYYGEHWLCADY